MTVVLKYLELCWARGNSGFARTITDVRHHRYLPKYLLPIVEGLGLETLSNDQKYQLSPSRFADSVDLAALESTSSSVDSFRLNEWGRLATLLRQFLNVCYSTRR